MQAEYLDLLPNDLRTIVNKIEKEARTEIRVEVDTTRARGIHGEPDPLACTFDGGRPTILIPAPGEFSEASVLHELLHIHRFILEGIPQLVVCEENWTPELEKAFTALDNDLEHLVIVPMELSLRPERRQRWIDVMNRAMDREQLAEYIQDDRERFALRIWAFAHHALPDEALLARTNELVRTYGIEARAERFLNELISALDSKEMMAQISVEHLRVPLAISCLEYVNRERRDCGQIYLLQPDVTGDGR